MAFDSLLIAMQTGKINCIISGMTATDERRQHVNFSKPYFVSKQAVIVPNDSDIQKFEDLKGKKRSNKVAHPRQLAMYLCRMETDETFPRIGMEFGGRDHSTVIFACDKLEKELLNNKELERDIKEIKSKL